VIQEERLERQALTAVTLHNAPLQTINQGVFQIFMPEQDLNGAEIGAGFTAFFLHQDAAQSLE